jgi:acylphosphatase
MQELHAIISGRVQMVMMRDFVCRKAHALGLTGYVKNLADGTVEALAQGEREALEKLARQLHKGSVFSRVDAVVVTWREPGTSYTSFNIDYSA